MEMPGEHGQDITLLLKQWSSGDQQALDSLITLVYPELRAIAARYMSVAQIGGAAAVLRFHFLTLSTHCDRRAASRAD